MIQKLLFFLIPIKIFFSNVNPDEKIYIVEHRNLAEECVKQEDWVIVQHRNEADKVVEIVKYRNLADKTVYFIKY